MNTRTIAWLVVVATSFALPSTGSGAFTIYSSTQNGGLAGFNAAAGSPPVSIHFDAIVANTNIGGTTIAGVTFNSPAGGAPLIVVQGSATTTPAGFAGAPNPATNKLFATTLENVFSPGGATLGPGPDNPVENDDLELVFTSPLTAFGFDLLSQSADGIPFTNIQVFNALNVQVFSGEIPTTGAGIGGVPGAADFWGIVATGGDQIGRIVIDESDNNAQFPDSNIGFDTFRFAAPAPNPIPEPSSIVLLGLGSLGLGLMTSYRR